MKYVEGDRIIVTSTGSTFYQKIGTVLYSNAWNKTVTVVLDAFPNNHFCFMEDSISKSNIESMKENKNMDKVVVTIPGNYEVAICSFLNSSSDQLYAYALFDGCATVGDHALVQSNNKYGVVYIKNIVSKNDHEAAGGHPVTNEIICKVDFSSIERRKEQRKRKEELRKQMDKLVKENQELILYQALAEKSPEMAELLNEYKSL